MAKRQGLSKALVMVKDDDQVSFEVGQKAGGSLWTVAVSCSEGLSEQEFAASLMSLAQDIISGAVSFDDAPDVEEH